MAELYDEILTQIKPTETLHMEVVAYACTALPRLLTCCYHYKYAFIMFTPRLEYIYVEGFRL